MAGQEQSKYTEILLSCIEENYFEDETILEYHSFARVISGEMSVLQGGKTYTFGPGDSLIFPNNQLSRLSKNPKDGQPYRALVIFLTPKRLREFYLKNPMQITAPNAYTIKTLEKHPLLESFFASLIPYFDLQSELPEKIISVKIEEAITILRTIETNIDSLLANFSQTDKIDIAGFMEKNYMFNRSIEEFGCLTGRSLTTFKRDFKRTFNATPQKWILQKRLELAHYKLTNKGLKANEVYLETGFENLSHFSFVFKKHFGYAPTEVHRR